LAGGFDSFGKSHALSILIHDGDGITFLEKACVWLKIPRKLNSSQTVCLVMK
jgi:hypothetical protein